MKVLVRTESLSKYYGKGGEIKAVDELDLEVYQGETFGALQMTEKFSDDSFSHIRSLMIKIVATSIQLASPYFEWYVRKRRHITWDHIESVCSES